MTDPMCTDESRIFYLTRKQGSNGRQEIHEIIKKKEEIHEIENRKPFIQISKAKSRP